MAFFKSSKGKVKTAKPTLHMFVISDITHVPRCQRCGVTQHEASTTCGAVAH